jgi:hypothetical protein
MLAVLCPSIRSARRFISARLFSGANFIRAKAFLAWALSGMGKCPFPPDVHVADSLFSLASKMLIN